MGWKAILAAERKLQRAEEKRRRDLERLAKEQAKLSALEQAKLEVDEYENRLEVLLSFHKEQGIAHPWFDYAAALAPHPPVRLSLHQLKARLEDKPGKTVEAEARDADEYHHSLKRHTEAANEWLKLRDMGRGVLTGEAKAYLQALAEMSDLKEISDIGSSLHFTVHSRGLMECRVRVKGSQVIPSEIKSLTSSGKLSVKSMPKPRFHEIYQDYVCSCILRVAREIFVLLPVDTVLASAVVEILETGTGQTGEAVVLSVVLPRKQFESLCFEQLDPSDAIEGFYHRGDAKLSRKSGQFEPVIPLTVSDIEQSNPTGTPIEDALSAIQRLRVQINQDRVTIPQGKKQSL